MSHLVCNYTIGIIIATLNASNSLKNLIKSLESQTDKDFEWVVADGGSIDGTLDMLMEASGNLNILIDSRPDCGIYDGINRAIKLSSGEYYLILGADDILYPNAVGEFKKTLDETPADFISAKVKINGKTQGIRKPKWSWLFGIHAYISHPSVALLIRKDLHYEVGFYPLHLRIAADCLFIHHAIKKGAKVKEVNFIAGEFCFKGISGTQSLNTQLEIFRVQVGVGHNFFLQVLLFLLRVLKIKAWQNIIYPIGSGKTNET